MIFTYIIGVCAVAVTSYFAGKYSQLCDTERIAVRSVRKILKKVETLEQLEPALKVISEISSAVLNLEIMTHKELDHKIINQVVRKTTQLVEKKIFKCAGLDKLAEKKSDLDKAISEFKDKPCPPFKPSEDTLTVAPRKTVRFTRKPAVKRKPTVAKKSVKNRKLATKQ